MRVTTKMMSNSYIRNVNQLTSGTSNSLNQLSSGMKIFRASENTAAAVKAYQTRTALNRNAGYKSNLSHADQVITSTESVLINMQEQLKEGKAKIVQALNTTNNASNRRTIAGELRTIRNQMLEYMNSNDSGFYIFGGSNTEYKPFSLAADGTMLYNGNPLTELTDEELISQLTSDSLYVDIGLVPEFNNDDTVRRNTILEYSIPGINIMGYGKSELYDVDGNLMKDENGDPIVASNNIYDLLTQLINEFEKPDGEYNHNIADALYGRFETLSDVVTNQLTDIGAKSTYIEYTQTRLDTLNINLQSKQSDIEDVDYAESYITYTSLYTSYQAALRIGSQIIGPSLFDYMR